jgi:hypothetical protein
MNTTGRQLSSTRFSARDLEKFETQFTKTDGCWLWQGCLHPDGYGMFQARGANKAFPVRAHRAAYALYTAPIAAGQLVLHRCDVRNCVNPAHLYLGTQQDNLDDAVVRNRTAKGSRSSKSKLTDIEVQEIRRRSSLGETQVILGKAYGVSHNAIGRILNGRSWQWLA